MHLPLVPRGMPVTGWPPVLATHGPAGPCAWHSHHALRFALALEGQLRVRTQRQGKWESAAGALTAPDAEHMLDAQDAELLLVFIDPESAVGTSFGAALKGPVRLFSDAERKALTRDVVPRAILQSGAQVWAKDAAHALGLPALTAPTALHPRVRKLLGIIREEGIEEDTSLELLASKVGLSPSRLMHVFTTSIGIPLRPYLAWLRVQRAAVSIVSGDLLSDAAQSAGFSDAAHMSRTFRRMLGIKPSLLRNVRCSL
jgi:AraC-like DNA-binding protein